MSKSNYPSSQSRFKSGSLLEEHHFSELLISEQQSLFRYAYALTKDMADAEDLMQETSLRALRNRGKYVENVNFRGWITTMMRRIFLNQVESQSRRWELFDYNVDPTSLPTPVQGSYFMPEEYLKLGEINQAIDELGEHNRQAFRMFTQGYKYNEIADELQIPVGTVKSRIFFARKQLQERLAEIRS